MDRLNYVNDDVLAMKARSLECRQQTPLNDGEIFRMKHEAWNTKCISERVLQINNDQIAKLSNKEFETVVNIGNRLYPKGKK
jgi:hypothetical protein